MSTCRGFLPACKVVRKLLCDLTVWQLVECASPIGESTIEAAGLQGLSAQYPGLRGKELHPLYVVPCKDGAKVQSK